MSLNRILRRLAGQSTLANFSLARPPVAEEEGEVEGVDDVIIDEVGGVVGVRAPISEQAGQIKRANLAIAIGVETTSAAVRQRPKS